LTRNWTEQGINISVMAPIASLSRSSKLSKSL
jgi:hypothetical protein